MSIYCQIQSNPDCTNDQAIHMLGSIFGHRFIDAFISGGSPANAAPEMGTIAPALMGGISSIAFSLAVVLASALLLTALLNSAQDGEAFGKGSTKATIVMRFLFSWLMLLPTTSGYSIIQVLLMGMVLWSNGSNNKLYQDSITQALYSTPSLNSPTSQESDIWGLRTITIDALRQIHCTNVLNAEFYNLQPTTNAWLNLASPGSLNVPPGWVANNSSPQRVRSLFTIPKYEAAEGYTQATVKGNDVRTFTKATFTYHVGDDGKKIGANTQPICGQRKITLQRFDTEARSLVDSIRKGEKVITQSGNGELKKAVGLSTQEQQDAIQSLVVLNQRIQNLKYNFLMTHLMKLEVWYIEQRVNPNASANASESPFANVNFTSLKTLVDSQVAESNSIVQGAMSGQAGTAYSTALEKLTSMLMGRGWTQAASIRQRVLGFQDEIHKANKAQLMEFTPPVLSESVVQGEQGQAIYASINTAFNAFVDKVTTNQEWNQYVDLEGSTEGVANVDDPGSSLRSALTFVEQNKTFITDLQTSIVYFILHGGSSPSGQSWAKQTSLSTNPMAQYSTETDVIGNIQNAGEYMMAAGKIVSGVKLAIETKILAAKLAPALVLDEMKDRKLSALHMFIENVVYSILGNILIACTILGGYMAIIIPSMPTIFFTTAVVAWFIHIIQAMAGLPLWSLMHMIPERTFAGSQTQGYVTVIALFLRPVLTLIGLWFGYILANPILFYVTDAFWGSQLLTVQSTSGWSLSAVFFGFITFSAWLAVYCTLMLAVCYMIFGLCAQLPNTVLEWLGSSLNAGNWGDSNAKESLQRVGSGDVGGNRGSGGAQTMQKPQGPQPKPNNGGASAGTPGNSMNVGFTPSSNGSASANGITPMPVSARTATTSNSSNTGSGNSTIATGSTSSNNSTGGSAGNTNRGNSPQSQGFAGTATPTGSYGAVATGGTGYASGTTTANVSNMTTQLNKQRPSGMSTKPSAQVPIQSYNSVTAKVGKSRFVGNNKKFSQRM
ncbi:TPA: DotA/TraY family protein [Acinetobacter baumannii]|uniref:DotA/TraY family protein n=1 Tax=Acinetobacter baumannii TaxID=470 RepID=UPI0033900DB9